MRSGPELLLLPSPGTLTSTETSRRATTGDAPLGEEQREKAGLEHSSSRAAALQP
jgi:hypothetical protein